MKDLPIVAKAVINIVLYIIYWAIFCLIVGIIVALMQGEVSKDLADKIALFGAILVLIISLILRKYFYICGRETEEKVVYKESYTAKKKPVTKKTEKKIEKKAKQDWNIETQEEDEIKIYVEKEIK